MKAVVCDKYGGPEVLKLAEVDKPQPKEIEVLIKIYSASVNSWDWDWIKGSPYILRLGSPFKPKYRIIGCDIAGVVEKTGSNVKRLKPGDEVFGDISAAGWGGFAEFVCADENALAVKPKEMTFDEAAAIPHAGVLALQGLRNEGKIENGQKILISGAGGGVGTLGLQIAKLYDTEVTCVDKIEKLDILKSLGADNIIDYNKFDFTKNGKQYDLIIDNVASHPISDFMNALNPNGRLVIIGGKTGIILEVVLLGKLISKIFKKHLSLLLHKPNRNDLEYLSSLFIADKLKPVIGKHYSLDKTSEAVRDISLGNITGKGVINIF